MDKIDFNLKNILMVGRETGFPILDEIKENEIYQLSSNETNSMMIIEWDKHENNIRVMPFDKISYRVMSPFNVDNIKELAKSFKSYFDFFR